MDDSRGVRVWLMLAGLNGAAAVVAGALGAHASAPGARALVETGAHYHLVHAAALVGIAALARPVGGWLLGASGAAFGLGCLLFGGGLYLRAAGYPGLSFVVPIGGGAFIVGWLLLAAAGLRARAPG
jgi:uncharacterized membrane protein YgdD (TMEM256/DUF423 family)